MRIHSKSLFNPIHIIYRSLLLLLQSVFAVSAADTPYNRIQALERTITVDGVISAAEWPEQHLVRLTQAFHDKREIRLYFAHDSRFLYLGAYVEDSALWADGNGSGTGNIWDSANDDSIEWYFDLNNSRDAVLKADDRFLALNISNSMNPVSGSGIVSRRSFNQGNGSGGSAGVSDPLALPAGIGMQYVVKHFGTVNNPGDTDTGYSMEVALPWIALNRTQPADGELLGINAIVIFDDTGSTRDWSDNREAEPPSVRFTTPARPDEYVELSHSTTHTSQSGLSGPAAYQRIQFHRNADVTPPDAVRALSTVSARPHSVRLQWLNPGDNGTQGVAAGFDVRYSNAPISAANFSAATRWPLHTYPNAAANTTQIQVMGLSPGTTYYFAVRPYDEARNMGALATVGPVSTPAVSTATTSISSTIYQGGVRVAPGGRYFMLESGRNFAPTGAHYLPQDAAIRHLYTGSVWNASGNKCHDFSAEPGAMQKVTDYLDTLQQNGINVMRMFLEDYSLNVPNNGNFDETNCAYWFEFPSGTYNPKMLQFLTDLLRLSAERGIYMLITPFDSFYYDNYFPRTPWSTANGGPLNNVNEFFNSTEALNMSKARWSAVITAVLQSGYADAVMGYEVLNEWDSWEWTRPDANDANNDAAIRAVFVEELARHIRSLDSERLIISSTTALDPRGALAASVYYNDAFDALLPHLYSPGNREPWNNPATHKDTAVVREQSRLTAWWTLNQLNRKPVLNGEWGPSDGWMPDPANPAYLPAFQEADDELLLRKLWFTELAAGAAGPGVRMQGGVRGFDKGLHLSDNMHATAQTIAAVTENAKTSPTFSFADFDAENRSGQMSLNGAPNVLLTGSTDGRKGLVYLHQDKNLSTATISGSSLNIGGLHGGGAYMAEFWSTLPSTLSPTKTVSANAPNIGIPDMATFSVPAFSDDWLVKFNEQYSARLSLVREADNVQFGVEYHNVQNVGAIDVYFVAFYLGEMHSLIRVGDAISLTANGVIAPLDSGIIPANGVDTLIAVPVAGLAGLKMEIYVGTVPTGSPLLPLKTLQKSVAFF